MRVIAALLLAAAAFAQEPTAANVPYGPHERNVIDFYRAEGNGPRPLLVYIHGGGWTRGDKQQPAENFTPYLDKGISYAAINYRLTPDNPLPAPVHDAVRAIQFIKSKASEWNIDTDRIVLTGGSAGACTSMYILLHDDLADPDSEDPIERLSTRVAGAAVRVGQTSIDPKVIEPWLGPNVLQHRMINMAVGEQTIDAALAKYGEYRDPWVESSPINHLTPEDPPLLMTYGADTSLPSNDAGHGIHHPVYGMKMKEEADAIDHETHLLIEGDDSPQEFATAEAFILDVLLGQ